MFAQVISFTVSLEIYQELCLPRALYLSMLDENKFLSNKYLSSSFTEAIVLNIVLQKPSLNWAEVLTRFDCDEFHVARRTSLVILSDIIAATIGNRFPLTFLFGKWNKL